MRKLSAIAVALTLLGSSAALAQNYGSYGNRGESADQQRNDNQYQNRNNQNRDQNGYGNQCQGRNDYQQGHDQGRNDYQGRQREAELRDNPHWLPIPTKPPRIPT